MRLPVASERIDTLPRSSLPEPRTRGPAGAVRLDLGDSGPAVSTLDPLAGVLERASGTRVSARGITLDGLRSGTLSKHAYNVLRERILRGDLPVGSALTETEIAAALGISRTPVRQALGLLLQEGLVEVGRRRQLLVRGFSPDRRAELLLLREALESISLERACEVMTTDDVDYLHLLLLRQRRAARAGREDEFIELDEEFHLKIAEAARLPILLRFLGQLRGFVRVMRLGTVRHPRHFMQVIAEHEAITEALERRDPALALEALRHHLHTSDYVADGTGGRVPQDG